MHRNEHRSSTMKRTREAEAEAAPFVVCGAICLETGSAAQDYIGLYGGDAKLSGESVEYVQRTVTQIRTATGAKGIQALSYRNLSLDMLGNKE